MPAEATVFTVRTDRPLLPTEPAERLLRVSLHVPRPEKEEARKPVHLSLVIDRSGSMSGEKIRLALHAVRQAIRALQEGDRFSVVAFDNEIIVPVPSTEATPEARVRAEAALEAVTARGNTNLGGGWLRGCAEVGAHLPGDALGRCLLLTDGLANEGITSPDELTRRAREQRLLRVTTSTIGLGAGFNEMLLGWLSEEGGGNFYFAERADQLPGFVARELGDVFSVVARDACVVIHAPEGAEVESLNDYPVTRDGATFSFSLGSLSGGHVLDPMFRVRLPGGPAGEQVSATVRLADRDGALPVEPRIQKWMRAAPGEVAGQSVDLQVIRPATALDAARARRTALELNRARQWQQAGSHLTGAAERMRAYAAGDPESLAEAERLAAEKDEYARDMDEMSMKDRHFRAMVAMKMGRRGASERRVVAMPASPRLSPMAEAAAQALSGVRGAPPFSVDLSLRDATISPAGLTGEEEDDIVGEAFMCDPLAVKVVLVEPRHADGWFSHWHESELVAVVSLAEVDALITYPVASFVAYELVLYGLGALRPEYQPSKLLHDETRACLFDLCTRKADVAIKLQAGHICAPCLGRLIALGFNKDMVLELWRAVQKLAEAAPTRRSGERR